MLAACKSNLFKENDPNLAQLAPGKQQNPPEPPVRRRAAAGLTQHCCGGRQSAWILSSSEGTPIFGEVCGHMVRQGRRSWTQQLARAQKRACAWVEIVHSCPAARGRGSEAGEPRTEPAGGRGNSRPPRVSEQNNILPLRNTSLASARPVPGEPLSQGAPRAVLFLMFYSNKSENSRVSLLTGPPGEVRPRRRGAPGCPPSCRHGSCLLWLLRGSCLAGAAFFPPRHAKHFLCSLLGVSSAGRCPCPVLFHAGPQDFG